MPVWFDKIKLSIMLPVLMICLLFSACQRPDTLATQAALIDQTLEQIDTQTPYPSATAYPSFTPRPTQTPYNTQTPYPQSEEEELIARPTSEQILPSPFPTQEPYPTEAPHYQSTIQNKILVNPGLWAKDMTQYGHCGELFEVKLGFKTPYFTYAIGNEVSQTQFLIVNVVVTNTSTETIPLLFHKQFKLIGDLNGEQVEYTSYGPAGQSAADQFGKHFLGGVALPPQVELDTYIAFDADYHATNWRLAFRSDDSLNTDCYFEIPIPAIEFGIQYYSTLQSEQAK